MNKLSLLSAADVQTSMKEWLITQRKSQKLSRDQLAALSAVPSSTIKKFEKTGQISFRQLLLLWQSLDNLEHLNTLTKSTQKERQIPRTIEEVLEG